MFVNIFEILTDLAEISAGQTDFKATTSLEG